MRLPTRETVKIVAVLTAIILVSLGSMYAGYRYPEVYIQQFDPMGLRNTPYMMEKNITNYCTPKTIPFTRITTKYWCVA